MNQELWNKILDFDFDNPPSEYGFSVRLASENFWTLEFTDQAILEYKKFMYLAATSEFMVSPSEIIDTVWHQHLIFTQSYHDFCSILGRHIQHVPSTHNKAEFERFAQAKDRTIKLYERDFGGQPENIWSYNSMFSSLHLEKAKLKIRTFIIFGILSFICLTVPAYYVLQPIYVRIDNPYFLLGFISLTILTFLFLEFYNLARLKTIVSGFHKASFIYCLQPYELVYLKTQKLTAVINGTVNELVEIGTIKINDNNSIELAKNRGTINKFQLQVTVELSEMGATNYSYLLSKLLTKPIFGNISNSLGAFEKYFNKSKKFGVLYYMNFSILALLVLLSFTRIVTGVLRDKPVIQIVIATIGLVVITVIFLQRLTKKISTSAIPKLYEKELLPARGIERNWQWTYFLLGAAALTASFQPIVAQVERNYVSSGDSGTMDAGSCGSSCSSCGGCGGD